MKAAFSRCARTAVMIVGGCLWLAPCVSWAEMEFCTEKTEEDMGPGYYGNGQSLRFSRAIRGGTVMCPSEEQAIEDLKPVKDTNRYYARLGYSLGRKTISGISNESNGSLSSGKNVRITSVGNNQTNLSASLGYVWDSWRLELEYLSTKKVQYATNPVFTDAATRQSLTADVSSTTFLFNVFYDYRGFAERIYPYVMFSAGGTSNRVTSAITPLVPSTSTANGTQNSFGMSVGAGVGVRFGLFSNFFLDVNARYVSLGAIDFKPQTEMHLTGKQTLGLVGVGLMFLF